MIDFKIEKNNIKFTTRFLIEIPDMALSMAGEDAVEIKRRVERVVSTGNVVTRLKRLADLITFIANDIAVELPRPNNAGATDRLPENPRIRSARPQNATTGYTDAQSIPLDSELNHLVEVQRELEGEFPNSRENTQRPTTNVYATGTQSPRPRGMVLNEEDEVPF